MTVINAKPEIEQYPGCPGTGYKKTVRIISKMSELKGFARSWTHGRMYHKYDRGPRGNHDKPPDASNYRDQLGVAVDCADPHKK